jgi:hypothetical protein
MSSIEPYQRRALVEPHTQRVKAAGEIVAAISSVLGAAQTLVSDFKKRSVIDAGRMIEIRVQAEKAIAICRGQAIGELTRASLDEIIKTANRANEFSGRTKLGNKDPINARIQEATVAHIDELQKKLEEIRRKFSEGICER